MNMISDTSIIMTGGAGTLGLAIAERRKREGWTGKLTVYSTDNHKHGHMRKLYPDVNFVQGDIRNAETLYNAMVGHDVCLHLAAVKVIPDSESYSLDTIDVNVNGSVNVCVQAINAGIKHVLGISTDKAAYPANAYGATKLLMEKVFAEYSRVASGTEFHLLRYGNVLESNGSVIEAWHRAHAAGEKILMTDPFMTRFWLSPQQAVDIVIRSLNQESGMIFVPEMPALSIGKLAEYLLGEDVEIQRIPLRPGEKIHECLVTYEESMRAKYSRAEKCFIIPPTTRNIELAEAWKYGRAFSSDIADELSKEQLLSLLENE